LAILTVHSFTIRAVSWNRQMLACYGFAQVRAEGELQVIRTMFAMAVAGLVFAAVSGTSQAAPIAPLAGVARESGNLTPVYYRHYGGWHWHCWWRHGYRHCW
jgi:hypothetical protein